MRVSLLAAAAALVVRSLPLPAQAGPALPPLPDSSGWGVHVLAVQRDPGGTLWVGTYGQGIYRLPRGASAWESIRHDTTAGSISWDFVQAFAFGPRGEVWWLIVTAAVLALGMALMLLVRF